LIADCPIEDKFQIKHRDESCCAASSRLFHLGTPILVRKSSDFGTQWAREEGGNIGLKFSHSYAKRESDPE